MASAIAFRTRRNASAPSDHMRMKPAGRKTAPGPTRTRPPGAATGAGSSGAFWWRFGLVLLLAAGIVALLSRLFTPYVGGGRQITLLVLLASGGLLCGLPALFMGLSWTRLPAPGHADRPGDGRDGRGRRGRSDGARRDGVGRPLWQAGALAQSTWWTSWSAPTGSGAS